MLIALGLRSWPDREVQWGAPINAGPCGSGTRASARDSDTQQRRQMTNGRCAAIIPGLEILGRILDDLDGPGPGRGDHNPTRDIEQSGEMVVEYQTRSLVREDLGRSLGAVFGLGPSYSQFTLFGAKLRAAAPTI